MDTKLRYKRYSLDEYKKLNYADIILLEKKLDLVLPLDYTKFLKKHNGVYLEEGYYFDYLDEYAEEQANTTTNFYGLNTTNLYSKFSYITTYCIDGLIVSAHFFWEEYEILNHYLTICDLHRPQLCLNIKGNNYGKIYYWDPDIASDISEEHYLYLANSFTDFLGKLKRER